MHHRESDAADWLATSIMATGGEGRDRVPATHQIHLDEERVYWSDRVTLPYRPHIGTLSCSPEIDSISSLTPDNRGGNMDLPDMGPGSVTYLPVRVPGARLFIGDAHACHGGGEVCGTPAPPSRTTLPSSNARSPTSSTTSRSCSTPGTTWRSPPTS